MLLPQRFFENLCGGSDNINLLADEVKLYRNLQLVILSVSFYII